MLSTARIRTRLFLLLFFYCVALASVQSLVLASIVSYDTYFTQIFDIQKTSQEETFEVADKERNILSVQFVQFIRSLRYSPPHIPTSFKCLSTVITFLVVNSLIVVILLFFRLDGLFIRPLEELVVLSERYHNRSYLGMYLPMQQRHPFKAVSTTFIQMLDRIDEDRKQLREKVCTLEVMNKELRDSRNQLVRSEKLATIGQLSAGLAHEIGNPLAIVQGYLDILKESSLSEIERREFCETSQKELERIGRLVGELLRFSRSENMELQEFELQGFLAECCNLAMMHKSVKASGLHFRKGDPLFVRSNTDMLRQIILNAILNAADSLENRENRNIFLEGKLLTRVLPKEGVKDERENCSIVEITVKDNGVGISKEYEEHLFEPFFTTKESGKGTGLGLFVSQMLAERLGGELYAGNRKNGVGFIVSICIPLYKENK